MMKINSRYEIKTVVAEINQSGDIGNVYDDFTRLDKKTVPILRGNRRAFLRKKRRFCNAKTAWFLHKQSHTERTPAVPDPPTCNSPASRRGALAPRLPPTFSGLRPMADFRHTAFAVSVHPCAHSAVRSRFCPISF